MIKITIPRDGKPYYWLKKVQYNYMGNDTDAVFSKRTEWTRNESEAEMFLEKKDAERRVKNYEKFGAIIYEEIFVKSYTTTSSIGNYQYFQFTVSS